MKNSRILIALAVIGFCPLGYAQAQQVRIAVLELFHPQSLAVSPYGQQALQIAAGSESFSMQASSPAKTVSLLRAGDAIALTIGERRIVAQDLEVTGRQNGAADFILSVPGKMHRRYRGTLQVHAEKNELIAVVTMDLETAVASVVAAESPPNAPLEALKAQAVAARAYFVAGKGRHGVAFDFCDTTHCQFLREPPAAQEPAALAAAQTRGLVLAYQDAPIVALYSASCGGHTHSLAELRLPVRGYPYYSVASPYCLRHPDRWSSVLPARTAAALPAQGTERARLELARRLGWHVLPSNNYSMQIQGDAVILAGVGVGHGIGLCQRSAAAMARAGSSFREILEFYYPNTTLKQIAE